MDWLSSAILAILASSALVAFIYLLLFLQHKTDYLKIWLFAYAVYSLRFLFQYLNIHYPGNDWLQSLSQLFMLYGSFLIVYGFYKFLSARFSVIWWVLLPALSLYIIAGIGMEIPFEYQTIPVSLFLGVLFFITGVLILKSYEYKGISRYLAGYTLIVWGIHKIDYPFIRPLESAAPYGYMLGLLLMISAAFSILLFFFDRSRNELSESRKKFQLLADNAYDLIYRMKLKPEPKFEYVSPSATKITGYTPEEHYNDPLLGMKIVHPADRRILEDIMAKGVDPDRAYTIRWIKKNGEVAWIQQRNVPVYDESGDVIAIEGIARDVTKMISSEEAVRRSDKRYESLYELSKMTQADEKGVINYALEEAVAFTGSEIGYFHFMNENEVSLRLFTWTKNVLENCEAPVLDDYPISEAGVWADCVRERRPVIHNDFINLPNSKGLPEGHSPVTRHMSIPVMDGDTIIAVAGVGNKIEPYTEDDVKQLNMFMNEMWKTIKQHRMQELLRKQNKALERSTVSIVITDLDGTIEYVNPCFTKITGYRYNDVIGKNPNILQSGETSDEGYEQIWKTIKSGNIWQGEFRNKKKDGSYYWESASISPIYDENGNITHFVGVKEDITEKKKMTLDLEKALKKAEEVNRIKSTLFANLSHEFRTPMNGIIGFASLMALRTKDAKQLDMIRKIRLSANRLMNTLESVLEFASLSSMDSIEEKHSIDIVEALKAAAADYQIKAEEKGLKFTFFSDRQTFFISANDRIISDILNNLIDNAVKFTEKGEINIEMRAIKKKSSSFAAIKIVDTGIGIEEKYKDIIFEEFRQVSEGYSRSHEGAGLGLALTKKMVQLLGGVISVDSSPGKGSVFTVMLPAADKQTYDTSVPDITAISDIREEHIYAIRQSTPKILVVEDNPINAELLEMFLEKHFDVYTVMKADDAVELTQQNVFAAFFIDINLGIGMNGIDLMKLLKEKNNNKDVPFIAATGYAGSEDKQRLLNEGFTHHIGKPFEEPDIYVLMKQIFPNHKFTEITSEKLH